MSSTQTKVTTKLDPALGQAALSHEAAKQDVVLQEAVQHDAANLQPLSQQATRQEIARPSSPSIVAVRAVNYSATRSPAPVFGSAMPGAIISPPLAWRCWPLIDDGMQHWPLMATALTVAAISGLVFGSFGVFGLVLAVQLLAAWRLWLPVEYELSDQGIRQAVLGRKVVYPWSAVRRCQILRDGILLSGDSEPGFFAAARGKFIPWSEHRLEVLAAVNRIAVQTSSGRGS